MSEEMKEELKQEEVIQEETTETQEAVSEETEAATEENKAAEETATEDDKATEEKADPRDAKIAELQEKSIRQLAEFENFRKRTEKEKAQMFEMGAKDVVEKILPVIDNFERGLSQVPEENKEDAFVTGMDMVYKQMITALEALGVVPIDAVGKEFDPNLHNAVMMVDDDSLESGVVAEEMQKGYMYKESVVRHSMVKVTN